MATIVKMDHLAGSRLYSPEEYIEVCQLLEEAGLRNTYFHTGLYPGTPKNEGIWQGLRAVARAGSKLQLRVSARFFSWKLGEYRDRIDQIVDSGANGVHIAPNGDVGKLDWGGPVFRGGSGSPGMTTSEAAEKLRELSKAIDYMKKKGLYVIMNGRYVTHQDLDTFIHWRNVYIEAGADALHMGDTKGDITPEATKHFVMKVRQGLKREVPIIYHAHDGFGLGTAVALAATTVGAWPQGSVNGIGDQGLASLEELVVALEFLYGVKTGINLKKLPELSEAVERITGIPNPPFKAITGAHIPVPEYATSYVDLLQGKSFFELNLTPYELDLVGRRPEMVMYDGLLTTEAVAAKLNQLGLPTDSGTVQKAKDAIKRKLDSLGNKFPVSPNPPMDRDGRHEGSGRG